LSLRGTITGTLSSSATLPPAPAPRPCRRMIRLMPWLRAILDPMFA
jgi:hypothetical protein